MKFSKKLTGVFARIFLTSAAVGALIVGALSLSNYLMLDRIYELNVRRILANSSEMVAAALSAGADAAELSKLCSDFSEREGIRTTIIASDGRVLFDSNADSSAMPNHIGRPEVRKALSGESQIASHFSDTLGISMLYAAVPAFKEKSGAYRYCIRQSIPLHNMRIAKQAFSFEILFTSLVALAASAIFSFLLARSISLPLKSLTETAKRLESGDFSARAESCSITEIGDLSASISSMADELRHRMESLDKRNCELNEIFGNMSECVFICTSDGILLRCNKSCSELFDLSDVALNRPLAENIRNSQIIKAVERTFSEKENYRCNIEIPGSPSKIFSFAGIRLDYKSRVPRALIVLHDVSAFAANEKMRRDFVAGASHELKTPITAIRAAAETMMADERDATKRRFISIVEKEAFRMNALVDDMLLLSKLEFERDMNSQKFEKVNLLSLIGDCIDNNSAIAESSGDSISTECPRDLFVDGDYTLLQIALNNLISNAVKYGGIACSIKVKAHRNPSGKIELSVSDTGSGIPSQDLPRIFERFYRVDKGRSRNCGGTGLGLALVKHVAILHSASVSVESELGKGSVFTLTFNS